MSIKDDRVVGDSTHIRSTMSTAAFVSSCDQIKRHLSTKGLFDLSKPELVSDKGFASIVECKKTISVLIIISTRTWL